MYSKTEFLIGLSFLRRWNKGIADMLDPLAPTFCFPTSNSFSALRCSQKEATNKAFLHIFLIACICGKNWLRWRSHLRELILILRALRQQT